MTHWFLERIASHGGRPAFITGGRVTTHGAIAGAARAWLARLNACGIGRGDVVVLQGDHAPESLAAMLALAMRGAVVVPLGPLPEAVLRDRCATAAAGWLIRTGGARRLERLERLAPGPAPALLDRLRARGRAGLVLFSSGSSGAPKACLLDLDSLLETARARRRGWVTLAFLLFDHIGGVNTMISVLGHGGTAVVAADRSVDAVATAIQAHRVELLPTSPTFLKMLLISNAAERHDLSSLELITYGTEVMPAATLADLHRSFPDARLKQTYGLSEIGIVPTRSRAPDSLWMQIGGDVEHKVVDGVLWLRTATAMLGYLNAPTPFAADGWLNTHDRVELDGEWIRILGRDTEMINVGGEKVHPSEVENVLLSAPNVRDVTVAGRASPVTGAVVVATVALVEPEDSAALKGRLSAFCRERLEPHKVPVLFRIASESLHSDRFKKIRTPA